MLKLSVKSETLLVFFPWRTMSLKNMDRGLRAYAVESNGLRDSESPNELVTAHVPPFHVLSNRHWNIRLGQLLSLNAMALIPLLEITGAKPLYSERAVAAFCFDISTDAGAAYYLLKMLKTEDRDEIGSMVYCTVAVPEVVENARALDETLYTLIKARFSCGDFHEKAEDAGCRRQDQT